MMSQLFLAIVCNAAARYSSSHVLSLDGVCIFLAIAREGHEGGRVVVEEVTKPQARNQQDAIENEASVCCEMCVNSIGKCSELLRHHPNLC